MRRLTPSRRPVGTAALALCWPLLGLAAGCQGSGSAVTTYEVKGKVLLANGKPLTQGRVTFIAADGLRPPASGDLGADGSFSLTTKDPEDGAAAGDYKVRIEPAGGRAAGPRAGRARRTAFPLKYVDEDSSELTLTVRAEPNRLAPITLK